MKDIFLTELEHKTMFERFMYELKWFGIIMLSGITLALVIYGLSMCVMINSLIK